MSQSLSGEQQYFASQHHIVGLSGASIRALMEQRLGYSIDRAQQFLDFQQSINRDLLRHPVISANTYTAWFAKGGFNGRQAREFVVQFSVFSNLFLIAQLKKTINADTLEGMRASKEILANEIGVVFKALDARSSPVDVTGESPEADLLAAEGTVEGGTFHFRAAHFEWLLRMASALDLTFSQVGKRHHGLAATLFFCDELARLYGSEDYMTSQAASYAVENWAAAGFWEQLISGFTAYNSQAAKKLPLAFFTYHAKIEAQHAAHTQEELEELYFTRDIDEVRFIDCGREMLNGVEAFWQGLDTQRKMDGSDDVRG
ncbi:hypothetical protein A9Q89_12580 [Gammaproteobacteria bacterium 53_120_T64]|nr:hypothetical protein A9Q89_12580 [Gammaproteobacteria bacterium 53_120_T64]